MLKFLILLFQLRDVMYFVVIIAVLVVAYSIARFAVLYPDNKFSFNEQSMDNFMRHVFMVPFFQLFGELFLDRPEGVGGNNC